MDKEVLVKWIREIEKEELVIQRIIEEKQKNIDELRLKKESILSMVEGKEEKKNKKRNK
jgi:hypothetical protein